MKMNTQVVRLAFAAGIASLLAINMIVTPATAQTRAALTQNVDEKGRVPFQQRIETSCSAGSCVASFNVPAAQRLVVTHVNALLGGANVTEPVFGQIRVPSALPSSIYSGNQILLFVPLTRIAPSTSGGTPVFIFDEELTMFADPNALFDFTFRYADTTNISSGVVELTVTGYLIPQS